MTLLVEHDWVECMTWPAMAVPSAVRFLPAVLNLWFYKPFFFFFFFLCRVRGCNSTPRRVMSCPGSDFF